MDLGRLNEKQQEAVRYTEGPLLILAGAGSGKTSTMTHRIAYMVEEKGIDPYEILAVTFTNKAAGEMRERIESLVGSTRGMWVMTFHAMCVRILRRDGEQLGFNNNFVIYDGTDQKTVMKNIIKELNLDTKEYKPAYLLSVISRKKELGVTPKQFRENASNDPRARVLVQVYELYQKQLMENNAMDFDDLLTNTLLLFRQQPEVLASYQDRFRYIMVDEYQDTNHVQYELVKALAGDRKNICVVGDDDQCIYQWRGADIRNILDFEHDYPEAKVIKLEQNYRSVGNILAAAHSVIENNRGRKAKRLWTSREKGAKIRYYRANNEKDEALFAAREIERLRDKSRRGDGFREPLSYKDFAILYRTNAQSRQFEEAFTREHIPYRVLSGLRYYDRKEIKDLMAYMRLVVNPRDDLSLRRIINEPKRGIGEKTIDKLAVFASVRGQSILEALGDEEVLQTLPAKAYEAVKAMAATILLCRQERENLRVSDIYDHLLVDTGYLAALEAEKTVESESRIENLMEFKSVIYDYESQEALAAMEADLSFRGEEETEAEGPSIDGFMEHLSLMSEIDNHDPSQDAVVMMTMHSAKGLEFPVVFLPGLEDGLFPGSRSFDSESGMEEERRLCYVGMTRAKERLILSSATTRTLYGRSDYTRESQFLREMDESLLEGDRVFKRRDPYGSRTTTYRGPGVSTGPIDGFREEAKPYLKPFDVNVAKTETRAAASGGETDFTPGDRVRHPKFGTGTVRSIQGKMVVVAFDEAGEKKMALGIAPLKKL